MRRRLVHFGNAGALAAPLEERALAAAGGNPRLMQRLDRIWADPEVDKESIIAALEAKNNMGPDGRLHQSAAEPAGKASAPLLALLSLYRLPVNRQAVAAVAGEDVLDDDLKPAVALGLIEAMGDAATGERRYRVSSDVSPLVADDLSQDERREAGCRAARWLHGTGLPDGVTRTDEEAETLQTHGLAGRPQERLREMGSEPNTDLIRD